MHGPGRGRVSCAPTASAEVPSCVRPPPPPLEAVPHVPHAACIGISRYIVSPLGVETIVEEDGGKPAEFEGEAGIELLNDLPWAEVSFVGVGSDEVKVELLV